MEQLEAFVVRLTQLFVKNNSRPYKLVIIFADDKLLIFYFLTLLAREAFTVSWI
jgi:hypothetical protein